MTSSSADKGRKGQMWQTYGGVFSNFLSSSKTNVKTHTNLIVPSAVTWFLHVRSNGKAQGQGQGHGAAPFQASAPMQSARAKPMDFMPRAKAGAVAGARASGGVFLSFLRSSKTYVKTRTNLMVPSAVTWFLRV